MAAEISSVAATTLAIKELQDRRKRAERIMLFSILAIVSVLFIVGLLIPTGVISDAAQMVNYFEQGGELSRNVAQNCKDPRNKNTVYCLDRAAQTESDWKSISRFGSGKSNQFTLHGK